MTKQLLLYLFLLINIVSKGQTIQVESNTLTGSTGQLPFWLWTNQLGRYEQDESFTQHFGIDARYHKPAIVGNVTFDAAANIDVLLADENALRFTELFGEFNWKIFRLKVGAFAENEKYDGLSASNGNLAFTRNARPHPRIQMGFNRFVPVTNWLSLYGIYEEGLLNDDRYVEDTHLHHKAFYFKIGSAEKLSFTGGIEHFVMWGGTHPEYGELQGIESYFGYITGGSGDTDALMTDQLNVLGNQYGTYQLKFNKEWNKFAACFYISHPFDDRSGLELVNYRDNLYGLYFRSSAAESFVRGIVIEYYHTNNQSGAYHLVEQDDGYKSGRGNDNYFNHDIYQSGATYNQHAMVSPLFAPIIVEDGTSTGFESTRFKGFHLGINGTINSRLRWKAMTTYVKHYGVYTIDGEDTYDPPRKQASTLLNIEWHSLRAPLHIGTSFAADHGSLFDNGNSTTRLGVQLSAKWLLSY